MAAMWSDYQRLLRRQESEKKDLKDRAAIMKNKVAKSSKKKKEKVLLDVARLEVQLLEKHRQELQRFRNMLPGTRRPRSLAANLATLNLESEPPLHLTAQSQGEGSAELEGECLEKLTEAEFEFEFEFEFEELACHDPEELKSLTPLLDARYLEMKEIPVSGSSMYRAVQDQLTVEESVESLRARAADYMRQHVDDFLPFFSETKAGVPYTRDDFMIYCDEVADGISWGGQVELQALSHVLQAPIEVIQADGPIIVMGEEYTQKMITLICLHHTSALGKHYNSVKPMEAGAIGGSPSGGF